MKATCFTSLLFLLLFPLPSFSVEVVYEYGKGSLQDLYRQEKMSSCKDLSFREKGIASKLLSSIDEYRSKKREDEKSVERYSQAYDLLGLSNKEEFGVENKKEHIKKFVEKNINIEDKSFSSLSSKIEMESMLLKGVQSIKASRHCFW